MRRSGAGDVTGPDHAVRVLYTYPVQDMCTHIHRRTRTPYDGVPDGEAGTGLSRTTLSGRQFYDRKGGVAARSVTLDRRRR